MRVIKHNLDDVLVISIVFDTMDDIESARAYFGGAIVELSIEEGITPSAPSAPAKELNRAVLNILNPLSKLLRKARYA